MRRYRPVGILFLIVIVFPAVLRSALPVSAQVSFFQPLTISECTNQGNLFEADFNRDGKPDLLCSDGTLNLGNGDGTFRLGTPVPILTPPTMTGGILSVADFNGDGKPDVLENGANGTLFVLLGNGDGTFGSPVSSSVGAPLLPVAASDLNGDGKADVVGIDNGSAYVCLSNGDGTFKAGVPYSLGFATNGGLLSLGDFNGDHVTDILVIVQGDNTPAQEVVLLGKGDGTFFAPNSSIGPNYNLLLPAYAVVGDFNGDGKLDLALDGLCTPPFCSPVHSPPVFIQLGNGDGTFQAPMTSISNYGPFAASDLNSDGKLDLVFAGVFSVAEIYLGNGDGTFPPSNNYISSLASASAAESGQSGTLAIADFNNDGKLDIVTSGGMLLGNGDGTFRGIPLAVVSNQPGPAVVGDFERNGMPDVAMLYPGFGADPGGTSSTLYILHNSGGDALSLLHTYSLPLGVEIMTADLNGDGNLDFGGDQRQFE